MWFATLILRNLWNRKVRSALTCLGMGIAVCTVVTLFGVIDVYEGAVKRMYETRGVDIIVRKAGSAQAIMGTIPEQFGETLRGLKGVKDVEPMLLELYSFEHPKLEAVYIIGWVPPPKGSLMSELKFPPDGGRCLKPEDTNKIILGVGLAKSLKLSVGQNVRISDTEFEIVGIFDSGNLLQDNSAILPLKELQALMVKPNRVTLFLVKVEDSPDKGERIKSLCQEIDDLKDEKGKSLQMSASGTQEHVSASLELRVIKSLSFATSFIALFIGVIGMLNTMLISVFERTKEIGTLCAVGWPRWRVVLMILQETLVLAAFGAVMGLAMSVTLTGFLHTFVQDSALKIPVLPPLPVVGLAVLLAFAVGLLGAVYPAYRASHLLPTEALRHD